MRVTLTLHSDVERPAKDGMHAERALPPPQSEPLTRAMGPLLVGETHFDTLATTLEDQELITKLRRGA